MSGKKYHNLFRREAAMTTIESNESLSILETSLMCDIAFVSAALFSKRPPELLAICLRDLMGRAAHEQKCQANLAAVGGEMFAFLDLTKLEEYDVSIKENNLLVRELLDVMTESEQVQERMAKMMEMFGLG